jgi:hypothetical protein
VQAGGNPDALDVPSLWGTYQSGRLVRAAAIHGMAREWRHSSSSNTAALQGHHYQQQTGLFSEPSSADVHVMLWLCWQSALDYFDL